MTQSDQSQKAQVLEDTDLDDLNGGYEAFPSKWYGLSPNSTRSVAGITADQKTIIGGFKSMSGMSGDAAMDTLRDLPVDLES